MARKRVRLPKVNDRGSATTPVNTHEPTPPAPEDPRAIPDGDWSARIRGKIKADGWTAYALAAQSGVAASAISRFLNGKRSLTLTATERICNTLGLYLAPENMFPRVPPGMEPPDFDIWKWDGSRWSQLIRTMHYRFVKPE